jgi:hypothetical protein
MRPMDFIDKIVELGFELHKNVHMGRETMALAQQPKVTTGAARYEREHKTSKRHKTHKEGAHATSQEKVEEPLSDDPAAEEARKFTLKIF